MCLGVKAQIKSKYIDDIGFKSAHAVFGNTGVVGEITIDLVWDEVEIDDIVLVSSNNALQIIREVSDGEVEHAADTVYGEEL